MPDSCGASPFVQPFATYPANVSIRSRVNFVRRDISEFLELLKGANLPARIISIGQKIDYQNVDYRIL